MTKTANFESPRWPTLPLWKYLNRHVNKNKKRSYRWQTARCRFVKLLRYCRTFLSEYVDKKFTRDYNVILYLSVFNSFWVIRCLSQCVSQKISIFTTFLFALVTPLWQSRKTLHKWKDNSVLAKPLAACTHLSATVSQLFEPQVPKIAVFTYRSPHFCFPWRRTCDYHPICCMDGKTIRCLPNLSQHVPIYLQ